CRRHFKLANYSLPCFDPSWVKGVKGDSLANGPTLLLFLLVLLLPVQAWAATATLVQSNSAEGSAVASIVSTFTSNVTTGNMIIAFVRLSTLTATTVTVTDTQGNTYVDAVAQNQDTDQHAIHIFYAKNVTGGADTVTAAFSSGANNHPWIAIYEYANMDTVAPLDKTAVGQGSGVTPLTAGTATTTQGNELLFEGVGVPNNYAGTISIFTGSGYSMLLQDNGTSRAATLAQNQDGTGNWTG